MNPAAVILEAELVKREKIRLAILEGFVFTPGDRRFVVRRMDVLRYVSERTGVLNAAPPSVRHLIPIVRRMGGATAETYGRGLFLFMRRAGFPLEVELQRARDLRRSKGVCSIR